MKPDATFTTNLMYELTEGVLTLTINRPHVRNAFTVSMWSELNRIVDQIRTDPRIRVVIIQGAGDEAFTSGSDIGEFAAMTIEEADAGFQIMEEAISAVESLPMPTIACLNGYALGGGLELALACDLRIASERATLGMPIARLGIMISPRFAKRIVDLIGPSRTKDLLYTGRLVGASDALHMGLVNYFVLSHALKATTSEVAHRVAGLSGASIRAAKEAVALCLPLSEASSSQGPYFIDRLDFPEGVAAFLAKREPRFQER